MTRGHVDKGGCGGAVGSRSRLPMAEWLTPERLMPRWPSPDTRNKISAANFRSPFELRALPGLLLRRLGLRLGAVQLPHRGTRRARAGRGLGAMTGVGGFEGHPIRISARAPKATPIGQRLGFIFEAHPQSPAQPPSLRRRAAANQRRASQPTATPITAPTMTASRFM